MILPAAFAKLAGRGRATVAFVPVRSARWARRGGPRGRRRLGRSARYRSQPWAPQTGRQEPLLARTARSTTHVADIVLGEHAEIWLSQLLYDSPDMLALVRATGCKTRAAFADLWMRHYDREWPILTEELCPVCEGHKQLEDGFECEECDPVGVILVEDPQDDDVILEYFKTRHGDTEVHVVHFELDLDATTRFLLPSGDLRGDDSGYIASTIEGPTTDILDAGASIPLSFQRQISRDAEEANEKLRRAKLNSGDVLGLGQSERNRRRAQRRAA